MAIESAEQLHGKQDVMREDDDLPRLADLYKAIDDVQAPFVVEASDRIVQYQRC